MSECLDSLIAHIIKYEYIDCKSADTRGIPNQLQREGLGSECPVEGPRSNLLETIVVAVEHGGDGGHLFGEQAEVELGVALLDHAA